MISNNKFVVHNNIFYGGNMHRLFRLSLLVVLLGFLAYSQGNAAPVVPTCKISGTLKAGDVRVFLKDTVYIIDQKYVIGGTLIIEPGTKVLFNPNGFLVDSTGGRIIADGFAAAAYTANPGNDNPNDLGNQYGATQGYADLRYFLWEKSDGANTSTITDTTVTINTVRDLTINTSRYLVNPAGTFPTGPFQYRSKENYVNNVLLNITKRKIIDFQPIAGSNGKHMEPPYDPDGNVSDPGDVIVLIPFEKAIMFTAARLYTDPSADIKLRINPWKRTEEGDIDVESEQIRFVGQPTNNISRELGHIIVLPGARAAFFRNCSFEGMRKDTTVAQHALYNAESFPELTADEVAEVNTTMRLLTNGTGGAITTLSSRTWILNCQFIDNIARHKGGALAILQAPDGFANPGKYFPKYYRADKNPNLTNKNGTISEINTKSNALNQDDPQIDLLDEQDDLDGGVLGTEFYNDYDRQAFDDGRIAVLLGRVRNNTFLRNIVQLANVGIKYKGVPSIPVEEDLTEIAKPGREYGDMAFGGAVYIAGKKVNYESDDTHMEIGFGVNNSINVAFQSDPLVFPKTDVLVMRDNRAYNYQASDKSFGARGGALYIGRNTSMIVAGQFYYNQTNVPYMQNADTIINGKQDGINHDIGLIKYSDRYSRGGAIYLENTDARLQVRGGPTRDEVADNINPTEFVGNRSAAGGAIYVAGTRYRQYMSPIIGGYDNTITARDYGFNIKFINNEAQVAGGAICSERNTTIYGAGGMQADQIIGYGGKYPVLFEDNKAGFSGGAVKFHIPDGTLEPENRAVHIVRADFINNQVGNAEAMLQDLPSSERVYVAGGGAVYSVNADLNLVKGSEFKSNKVYNGNGGAIAIVHPMTSKQRFFITDIDNVTFEPNGVVASSYSSKNEVFANSVTDPTIYDYPADERMMTRFYDNQIIVDDEVAAAVNGSGTTQIKYGQHETNASWFSFAPVDNALWVVGSNGAIIKLVDGKKASESNYSNVQISIHDVFFTSKTTGYAVGDAGIILKTTDEGITWVEKISNTNKDLKSITFATADIGWAVGADGRILKTTDAGTTWVVKNQSATTSDLLDVEFVDELRGIAVGKIDAGTNEGVILATVDGGNNWVMHTSNTLNDLKDIAFINDNTAMVVGNSGVILKTIDAWTDAWSTIYSDLAENFNAIDVVGDSAAFVVGDDGIVLKTVNQGSSWTETYANTTNNLYSVYAQSESIVYAGSQLGLITKSTDGGTTWADAVEINTQTADVKRYHPLIGSLNLPENGIGLGGALYILDEVSTDRTNRVDSVNFNRVRMQNNKAFSGAAVYSDNYQLQLKFSRSLITGNEAYSAIGNDQNYIYSGFRADQETFVNYASSDLAGAVIYGEAVGPIPATSAPEAGNSIYNNVARFIVRLPDAPNTKGVLNGTSGVGLGGTDTLRGNYWGRTDANVAMKIDNKKVLKVEDKDGDGYYEDTTFYEPAVFETFFVDTYFKGNVYNSDDLAKETQLRFTYLYPIADDNADPREQGPFESYHRYDYVPVPLSNQASPYNENIAGTNSFPERKVMSGNMYDIYDKGTDIKTIDYSNRNMSPIEDFAVGIPPLLRSYNDPTYPSGWEDDLGYTKYVRRWIRDPFIVDSLVDMNPDEHKYEIVKMLQDEWRPNKDGSFYHPIGYPLYLECQSNYEGEKELANHDTRLLNESVFFVINRRTSDFIRVNLRQVSEEGPRREVFRARVEFIPDSSDRNESDLTRRRSEEGLLTFGDPLVDFDKNPYNEAAATLLGRKYNHEYSQNGPYNKFGKLNRIFSNRTDMPKDNDNNMQTFFGGERYRALPVAVGDEILVISRTVLWREGGDIALRGGMLFNISSSTRAPEFTHEIIDLQTDTVHRWLPSEYPWEDELVENHITDFLNKIFITEDRIYPWIEDPTRNGDQFTTRHRLAGQGLDSILTITGRDSSKFYDPRALLHPDKYTQLTFRWSVDPTSGLARWLQSDVIYPSRDPEFRTVAEREDDALGYLELRGMPINPFVVPGGEKCTVYVENYPPHWRTIDSLKKLTGDEEVSQDVLDQFINIFPKYLHAGKYDIANARYLQQDTINSGQNFYAQYVFDLFVVDSTPRFILPFETEDIVTRRMTGVYGDPDCVYETTESPYVVYSPSVYTCYDQDKDVLRANLTYGDNGALRFKIDVNTDDEAEDNSKVTKDGYKGLGAWDFRFGRTAYGFANIAIRGDEVVYMDTEKNEFDPDDGVATFISQAKPFWMVNDNAHQYFRKYDDPAQWDEFASDFQTYGKLYISIPQKTADTLLTPRNRQAGEYNDDTTFAIVVNDGHTGINIMEREVVINFAPQITNVSLPRAKEDYDYNPQLMNDTMQIKVKDPNMDQWHTYHLVYSDAVATELGTRIFDDKVDKDPCFPEAGQWDLTNLKTTPKWLRINQESGLLYGTPGIDDAPKTAQVTVYVEDEFGLSDVKTFSLQVDSTNHTPVLADLPAVKCVEYGAVYSDTMFVYDADFMRGEIGVDEDKPWVEEITIEVVSPTGVFTVVPDRISGIKDSSRVSFVIYSNSLVIDPSLRDADDKVTVEIKITDKAGNTTTKQFRIKFSNETVFTCPITVRNAKGALQEMEWGIGKSEGLPTTGDATDGAELGSLDGKFCEYELPPVPHDDVFDVRWEIPLTNGTLRNIYPPAKNGVTDEKVFRAVIQSGGESGVTTNHYPIYIKWDMSNVPSWDKDPQKNPTKSTWHLQDAYSQNGNLFSFNMNTGKAGTIPGDITYEIQGTEITVIINRPAIDRFVIKHIWSDPNDPNAVDDGAGLPTQTLITSVTPNPFVEATNIFFNVAQDSKVRIDVVDALGQVVNVLENNNYSIGTYNIRWNGTDVNGQPVSSGTYTIRLTSGSVTSTFNVVIIK